jgi:hypothetical protein
MRHCEVFFCDHIRERLCRADCKRPCRDRCKNNPDKCKLVRKYDELTVRRMKNELGVRA